jgi:hypothetical protein
MRARELWARWSFMGITGKGRGGWGVSLLDCRLRLVQLRVVELSESCRPQVSLYFESGIGVESFADC